MADRELRDLLADFSLLMSGRATMIRHVDKERLVTRGLAAWLDTWSDKIVGTEKAEQVWDELLATMEEHA